MPINRSKLTEIKVRWEHAPDASEAESAALLAQAPVDIAELVAAIEEIQGELVALQRITWAPAGMERAAVALVCERLTKICGE